MKLEKVKIPEGISGVWRVERFSVSQEDSKFDAMHAMSNGGRYTPPGTYTRLMRGQILVMSDTPDEMRDHYEPVRRASGHVLVNGLGLGMVVAAMLKKPEVERVTVVEISKDVIALTGPTLEGDPRLEIVNASAFDYQPPRGIRYGAVWHDIWDNICGDNVPEMTRLKRKYGRRSDWQGCWCEWQCRKTWR